MAVMDNKTFVNKLKNVATNYKTLYVYGCFGAPLSAKNKKRYTTNHSYNKNSKRKAMINNASIDTFGFDCVNLIKAILWGWNGDVTATYGGAKYKANGVPDISADGMFNLCTNKSSDFSKIEIGEAVWLTGHIGIYIGNGLAVECTPAFDNKVQITAVANIGTKKGYNSRKWTKHGKIPYIKYIAGTSTTSSSTTSKPTTNTTTKDNFLPSRGYWKRGDSDARIGRLATFMYETFPKYTSKKALGNLYGPYLQKSILEFQRRTGLKDDGFIGPLTYDKLKKHGFKG